MRIRRPAASSYWGPLLAGVMLLSMGCEEPAPAGPKLPGDPADVTSSDTLWGSGTDDKDQDGVPAHSDCDDFDPDVFPGADELPYDGKDNDCDPTTPDDDLDGDGSVGNLDCDDADAAATPGGVEVLYDGKDNDCDPVTKDDDLDGDGFPLDEDCDDEAAAVSPAAVEVYYDGVDNDCDPATADGDQDGDGIDVSFDCDDLDSAVFPGAVEVPYDGLDNDCDPVTKDDDLDGDGFAQGDDCDDADPTVHPGATEVVYDGLDNDCDADTLDDDLDGDGVLNLLDCDDSNPDVAPGKDELPDGLDNDCDDVVDEGTAAVDLDGDGYCVGYLAEPGLMACSDGSLPGDCDDANAALTPADNDFDLSSTCQGDCDDANPTLNGLDEDGDGMTTCAGDCDDSDPDLALVDWDGDGFSACVDDCNDWDPLMNPAATEVFYNDLDDDCDPTTLDDDQDGDGVEISDDCDDTDPTVFPGALESPDNGIDEDCDGSDATALGQEDLIAIIAEQGGLLFESGVIGSPEPILVTGDIIVPIGVTLALLPGVELRFMGPYKILVHGRLLSAGSALSPVSLTSGLADPAMEDWHGVRFEAVGTGRLSHTAIRYATHGVDLEDASVALEHMSVRDSTVGVWVGGTDASPTLDHVSVEDCLIGLMGSWSGWGEDVRVSYSSFIGNGDGILLEGAAAFRIENSVIANNTGIGVQTDGTSLWHNTLSGNAVGILTQGGWDVFERNEIHGNGVGVELGAYPTRVTYHHNNLQGNTDYASVYVGGNDDGTVNAEFNWWGSKTGPGIAASIWDFFDDPTLYTVDTVPFLRLPLVSIGPIPEGSVDADGDAFFSIASGGNDCDDTKATINPDAVDSGPDGIDDDCDGQIDEDAPLDADGDGWTLPEDCHPQDATIYPGAPEVADNGVDENCNGFDLVSIENQPLSGVLLGDVQLTASEGPFIVTGDLYVAPNCVLVLGPGASVRFDGFFSLIVYGELLAMGNPGAEVMLSAQPPGAGAGSWKEVLFADTGTGSLARVDIMDASVGVQIHNSQASLHQSKVHDCTVGVRVEGSSASALIELTEIADNVTGIEGTFTGSSEPVTVRYSTLKNNAVGIAASASAKFDVRNSLFMGNTEVALQASGGTFAHNKFISNHVGIATQGGWDSVIFNEFILNDVGVSIGVYPTRPQIHYNTFKLNKDVAMKYVGGMSDGPVNAQNNWWNTDTLSGVRAETWDVYDDVTLFEILVVPFAYEEKASVGPIPQGSDDADGDGFYSEASGGNDCDDADALVNPDALDNDDDGIDDDCDGESDEDAMADLDDDGFLSDVDCDDNNPAAYPGAPEVPQNGVDESCNGSDLLPLFGAELGGYLLTDTWLTAAGGPYEVTSDVVVLPGTVLSIQAGAELRFHGFFGINVKGILLLAGTPEAKVVLTSAKEEPAVGDWMGVRVHGGSEATLEFAEFSYVDTAVSVDTGASPQLLDVSVATCHTGVKVSGTDTTMEMVGGAIVQCDTGIEVSWAAWASPASLVGVELSYNGNGVLSSGSSKLNISECLITHSANVGLMTEGALTEHNFIAHNKIGVVTQGGWDTIRYNVVTQNETGIKVGPYPSRPLIKFNNIVGNTYQGLVYVGGTGDGPVDATQNWWGTTDAVQMSQNVWDIYDDPTLFEVIVLPALPNAQFDAGPTQ